MRSATTQTRRQTGFTLIELMVVVIVIAILTVIAYPAYLRYIVRGHRANAQQFMLDVATQANQYRLDTRRYPQDFCNGEDDLAIDVPTEVAKYYGMCLEAANAATPPTFTITATPKAGTMQAGAATMKLTSAGKKTPPEAWK